MQALTANNSLVANTMSNKSPESQLKEALSILGEFKASAEALKANADASTLHERLKKIEDTHSEAYKKVQDMEAALKQFHEDMKAKFDIIEKKHADIYVDKSNDAAEEVQENEHEIQKIEEAQESAKEAGEAADKVVDDEGMKAENVVDGVNEKVVKGQPNPANDGKPTAPILKPETTAEAKDAPNAEPKHVIENDGHTKIEKNDAFDVKADVVVVKDGESEEEEETEEETEGEAEAFDAPNATPDHENQVGKKTKIKVTKQTKPIVAKKGATAAVVEANATVVKMKAEFESLLARIEKMEAAEKSAEAKVAKTLASIGVEPVASTVEGGEKVSMSAEEIVKAWEGMKEPKAQRAFYLKHEEIIRNASFGKVRKSF